jgi:hypothetical protein
MNWFNRILVLALILCLSRTPIPWGHSHIGMDAEQLAVHLHKYHPATRVNELPKGWHWHLTRIERTIDEEKCQFLVASLHESLAKLLNAPMPDATISDFAEQAFPPRTPVSTDIAWAHAVRQQQTYLRLNVLLI